MIFLKYINKHYSLLILPIVMLAPFALIFCIISINFLINIFHLTIFIFYFTNCNIPRFLV